jgi:hypothetical protein
MSDTDNTKQTRDTTQPTPRGDVEGPRESDAEIPGAPDVTPLGPPTNAQRKRRFRVKE